MLSSKRERRARAQRGSVLSALLVIVAFLSILGGALMNEISGQFLLTHTLTDRVVAEATINSSAENAIGQLQARTKDWIKTGKFPLCSTDNPAAWSIPLNGMNAAADAICRAIAPDQVAKLTDGTFPADGAQLTVGGQKVFVVGDSGGNVYAYTFGTPRLSWAASVGRGVTGPPSQSPYAPRTAFPVGSAVALLDDNSGRNCFMAANGTVTSPPGFENHPAGKSPYFPDYAFFGDSSGTLWVYDGSCNRLQSAVAGGPVVGSALVLTGRQDSSDNQQCGNQGGDEGSNQQTTSVDIFAVINRSGGARLAHFQYCETRQGGQLISNDLRSDPSDQPVGLSIGNAVGVAFGSTTPSSGTIRLAVTGTSGIAVPTIQSTSDSYSMSSGQGNTSLGGFTSAPYWWHSSSGDRIGAANQTSLLVLDMNLNQQLRFDGSVPITTTPGADPNGDWYFGANDGFIYDVEPPAKGTQMFPAARFGPGGAAVTSSPIVTGCSNRTCMYFGTGASAHFAQIGPGRVMDLSACLTSGSGSTTCTAGSLRLWARVEVGDPAYFGTPNQGVNVIGWSYYHSSS